MAGEPLPDIPGLHRSYRGMLHDMEASAALGEDGRWHVEIAVPGAWHANDDHLGEFGTEAEALSALKEFADTGNIPGSLRPAREDVEARYGA